MCTDSPSSDPPGGFGIGYKVRAITGSSSLDTAPVTGSLLFNAHVCRLAVYCATGFSSCVLFSGCDGIRLAVFRLFLRRVSGDFVMATDRVAPAGVRSGITFGVTLDVPWNAPEAYVHLHLDDVVDLDTVPDVLGLIGRRPEAAVFRVLQGRDARSVRALILDLRVLEDLAEPSVFQDKLSLLRLQWPVTVLRNMVWLKNELDAMHAAAKKRYRHSYCAHTVASGLSVICTAIYIISTYHLDIIWISFGYHLDLDQLWRCPVSWCTVWKGTPQDCMNHVRGAHDVLSDIKSASLEKFFPPWTVRRQIWADALKPCHSEVSTDVLLFSEMQLSLVHQYRVFRRGLPLYAFCKDYLSRLRVFVSQASALVQCGLASPVLGSSVSPRHVRPSVVETESPRNTRRVRRRMWPTRIRDKPIRVPSPATADRAIQDFTGAVIYDNRPRILPVSIQLKDIGRPSRVRPTASASLAAPPVEETMVIGSVSPERAAIPEFGVTPSDDPGTDLEDELLRVSPLPTIVSSLPEPDETLPVSPSLYPAPPVPGQHNPAPTFDSRFVPLRDVDERLTIDFFLSYMISLAQSYYDPATSPVTFDVHDVSECLSPGSPAAMDRYLAEDGDLFSVHRNFPCYPCLCGQLRMTMFRLQSLPRLALWGASFRCPRWCRLTCLGRAPSMQVRLCWGPLPMSRITYRGVSTG